jgi:hypothetical protein
VSGEQYAYARIWHEMVCTQLIWILVNK